MENQFLHKLAEYELRPTIIDRVSKNLIFYGFPLASCTSVDDPRWLIQVYVKGDDGVEQTGFPNGMRTFCQRWSDRTRLSYKMTPNFSEYVYGGGGTISGVPR